EVTGREDDPRALAVPGMQGEPQVALFVPGRHPRARTGPLVERDHERDLVDRGPSDPLHHQGETGPRRRGGGPCSCQGGPGGHRDRGALILGLDDQQGVALLLPAGLRDEAMSLRVEDFVFFEELYLVTARVDWLSVP